MKMRCFFTVGYVVYIIFMFFCILICIYRGMTKKRNLGF